MTIEAFSQAVELASESGLFIDEPMPANDLEIRYLSEMVGDLPESYRYFLETFGTASIDGLEFYGLVPGKLDVKSVPNTYWLTKEMTEKEGLPKGMLVVEGLGDGFYACIALSALSGAEAPVVVWDTGLPDQPIEKMEKLSPSFGEYVQKRVHELLDPVQ